VAARAVRRPPSEAQGGPHVSGRGDTWLKQCVAAAARDADAPPLCDAKAFALRRNQ